jgi:hypothetical protein
MQIVMLAGRDSGEALFAALLFVVFPFVSAGVPWVTAMPHLLVTALTLLALFAALKAEHDEAPGWWGVSLFGMALAPFAHESGVACAAIAGGVVVIQHGVHPHKRMAPVILGGVVSVAVVFLRGLVPGVREATFAGLQDWPQNAMFFLHGLVYPVAPIIGWLVERYGGHDFTLIAVATLGLAVVVVWAMRRGRDWRWGVRSLWWWACAAMPAAASLRYGYLYVSPRVHALSAVGIVMLWAGVFRELSRLVRDGWGRDLVSVALVGLVLTQNFAFLQRQRSLFGLINAVYQRVLYAAEDPDAAPLGFVNLPRWLGRREKTYALISGSVTFLPHYSNVAEFIEVNRAWRPAEAVMYSPVLQGLDVAFGFQGEGLTWEEMRQFAGDHRTVWLARWRDGTFALDYVGSLEIGATSSPDEPLVRFEGGPVIESASVDRQSDGHWLVAIDWLASGSVDGQIFVHVRDADGSLVAQADGPALGGMIPPWLWSAGDRIHDMRHILVEGSPLYTVEVGLSNSDGRFPAYMDGVRCPEDAPPVATIIP